MERQCRYRCTSSSSRHIPLSEPVSEQKIPCQLSRHSICRIRRNELKAKRNATIEMKKRGGSGETPLWRFSNLSPVKRAADASAESVGRGRQLRASHNIPPSKQVTLNVSIRRAGAFSADFVLCSSLRSPAAGTFRFCNDNL